jgi:transposase
MVAAKIERDAAMVAALRAGASLREVAKAAGMSMSQTQTISKAGGWPDAKEIKRREAEQAEKDRWNTMIEDYRAGK